MQKSTYALISLYIIFVATYIFAAITAKYPLGSDFPNFHVKIAELYASGQNGMFSPLVFEVIRFPYPPIFHLMLVPSVWLGVPNQFAVTLEIILPAISFGGFLYLVNKFKGPTTALLAGLILMGCTSFMDGVFQPRPNSLDLAIMPLLLIFFLNDKPKSFLISAFAMAYNHGAAAASTFYALPLLHKNKRLLIATILVILPIAALTLYYFSGAIQTWSAHDENLQEPLFWSSPLTFIPKYAGATLLGIIGVIFTLKNYKKAPQFDKSLSFMVLGLTIMIPLWADRFLQYAAIPLAALAASYFITKPKLRISIFGLALFACIYYTVMFWQNTIVGNWWVDPSYLN